MRFKVTASEDVTTEFYVEAKNKAELDEWLEEHYAKKGGKETMSNVGIPQFNKDNLAEFSVACGKKCGVAFSGRSTKDASTATVLRKHKWRFKSVHGDTRWVCPSCLES
jgi:hypothetical protein